METTSSGDEQDFDEVRSMLESRCEDIESGRVQPIDGEEVFARLRRRSEVRRASMDTTERA